MKQQTLNLADFKALLSPDGQRQLVDFVRRAKEERGAGWLDSLKADYPTFSWIVDLVANRTADEAFQHLQNEFPIFPLSYFEGQIHNIHAALRSEIDKPRG